MALNICCISKLPLKWYKQFSGNVKCTIPRALSYHHHHQPLAGLGQSLSYTRAQLMLFYPFSSFSLFIVIRALNMRCILNSLQCNTVNYRHCAVQEISGTHLFCTTETWCPLISHSSSSPSYQHLATIILSTSTHLTIVDTSLLQNPHGFRPRIAQRIIFKNREYLVWNSKLICVLYCPVFPTCWASLPERNCIEKSQVWWQRSPHV